MKIVQTKIKSKDIKEFCTRVWKDANIEHYGADITFNDHDIILTVRENNNIIGMLSAKIGNGVIFIRELLVDYNHQGKGIGTQLLQKLEEIAEKENYHKIYLETGKGWKAEQFYLSNGFEKTVELKKHYHNKDFVIYTKFL